MKSNVGGIDKILRILAGHGAPVASARPVISVMTAR